MKKIVIMSQQGQVNHELIAMLTALFCIHLKKVHPESSGTGFCEGLRSVTLGEVKWCSEVPADETSQYAVGVKYFEPVY